MEKFFSSGEEEVVLLLTRDGSRSHGTAQTATAREHDGLPLCQMYPYYHELRDGCE